MPRARGFPDDAIGARTLYPFANRETDIAISNFRWVSANTTGLILSTGTITVRPGGRFTTGFAFGNLGTETVSDFEVIIVLSPNDIISTYDRTIATGTGWGTAAFLRRLHLCRRGARRYPAWRMLRRRDPRPEQSRPGATRGQQPGGIPQ